MSWIASITQAAIGICKNCGRGVCRSCARDLGAVGIACSEDCGTELTEYRQINQRAKDVYGVGAGVKRRVPLTLLMWAALALVFGGFVVYEYTQSAHVDVFSLLFTLLCLVLCIATYVRAKALKLNY